MVDLFEMIRTSLERGMNTMAKAAVKTKVKAAAAKKPAAKKPAAKKAVAKRGR